MTGTTRHQLATNEGSEMQRKSLNVVITQLAPDQSGVRKDRLLVCQGGEEIPHTKDVTSYRIVCKKTGYDWGCFDYCSRCVAIDRESGLDVRAIIGISPTPTHAKKITKGGDLETLQSF